MARQPQKKTLKVTDYLNVITWASHYSWLIKKSYFPLLDYLEQKLAFDTISMLCKGV
jgi:hypothetical protein